MGIEAGSSTYYQAKRGTVQDGLVLHLDAGVKESYSGGTNWYNLADRTKNASLVNGPVELKSRVGGNSISFDGTNDYVNTNSMNTYASSFHSEGVTYAVWAKFPTWDDYWYGMGIFGHQVHGGYYFFTACGLMIFRHKLRTYTYGSQGYQYTESVSNVDDDIYHYLMCTFNPDDQLVRIYVDGQLERTGTTAITNFQTGSSFYIGGLSGGNKHIKGDVAQAHLYTRDLSADEISQNYNATRHRFGV